MTREQAINFLLEKPYKFGHLLGFKDLNEMHNKWIIEMIRGKEDKTLQAHRGSFKTSCVSIALSIIIILMPRKSTMFMRKTDNDVKEVIRQVYRILDSPITKHFVNSIYGINLQFETSNKGEINTNLCKGVKGTNQLIGIGLGGSLTGKHFDRIFTDDIVNINDRISKAERDRTKLIYQELQNIKNRDGRIFNTGTPWHKDDCFSIMPEAEKYDVYSTRMMTSEQMQKLKQTMTNSLWCANYELKHIAEDDVIFTDPMTNGDPAMVEQGTAHIDAAYGGEDYTAFTICRKSNGKYYVFGKLWNKHIDDVEDEIIRLRKSFNAGKIWCEDNGDKGYLAKSLRIKGERVINYHESMNKYIKISTYLKDVWKDVIFVKGTDSAYIEQICDYNENAEHDDAPDSLASIIVRLWSKKDETYQSIYMR